MSEAGDLKGKESLGVEPGYTIVEAKALHEVGVRNHGWYMTEAEHRGVLDVIERLEKVAVEAKLVSDVARYSVVSGDVCVALTVLREALDRA